MAGHREVAQLSIACSPNCDSARSSAESRMARSTAMQVAKYDPVARAATKEFMKPIPREELESEIDIFCELFARPEVMAALKKFVEDSGPMPYLP